MLRVAIRTFDLPLKHPFTISRSTVTIQPTVIVELDDGTHTGYGEATTNDYYGMTLDRITSAIESVARAIEASDPLDPVALWNQLRQPLADEPFALCAIDQAAYDLWGKQQGKPVYQLWGLDRHRCPPSNFTIGIDSIERMIEKLHEMPGWPVYKIKLGTDNDLQIIRQLREQTDATFRVDANCGWSVDQTIELSRELAKLDVEFIEQPLPADDVQGAQVVYAESSLPIIADESCIVPSDVDRCHNRFHGVNIKLVKCGGMTPAREMIQRARQLGMKVMVGCMTESSVGISAIAQLLPMLDYVDMDGADLLAEDIARGVRLRNGICEFPETNGNGVTLIA